MSAEVQRFLDVHGVEHRKVQVHEGEVGTRRHGRTLCRRVVADDHQSATVLRCAGVHAVPDGITGTIEPGCLSVPDAQYAVVAGVGLSGRQLTPHDRGCAQFLVHSWLHHEGDARRSRGGAGEFLIEPAQR
jgi:hypothetical protein